MYDQAGPGEFPGPAARLHIAGGVERCGGVEKDSELMLGQISHINFQLTFDNG